MFCRRKDTKVKVELGNLE